MTRVVDVSDLVFEDLEPVELPVRIGYKEYVLREASVDVICKWRNAAMRLARFGGDGKLLSMGSVADVEPMLVSLCLFEVVGGKRQAVAEATIRTWPVRIQSRLFDAIKKISGLEEEEETEAVLRARLETTQRKLEDLEAREKNGASTTGASDLPTSCGAPSTSSSDGMAP